MEGMFEHALWLIDSPLRIIQQKVPYIENRDHQIKQGDKDLKREEDVIDGKTDKCNEF